MELSEYQARATGGGHTYDQRACPVCGNLDGCHVPGRVRQPLGSGIRPKVVCLCGSTRFGDAYRAANLRETLEGNIVLTVGCDFKSDDALQLSPDAKACLDQLHLRKIEMADEVLILNVGGYLGESTRRELAYAIKLGKRVRALEFEDNGSVKGA
jgi:hypothetical protein